MGRQGIPVGQKTQLETTLRQLPQVNLQIKGTLT